MPTVNAVRPVPPSWLVTAARSAPPRPVPLRGTAKQVAWAESIRRDRLVYARAKAGPQIAAVLSVIEDSTWFIANRDVPLSELAWPTPDQIAARVRQPATCPHCGSRLDGGTGDDPPF